MISLETSYQALGTLYIAKLATKIIAGCFGFHASAQQQWQFCQTILWSWDLGILAAQNKNTLGAIDDVTHAFTSLFQVNSIGGHPQVIVTCMW